MIMADEVNNTKKKLAGMGEDLLKTLDKEKKDGR